MFLCACLFDDLCEYLSLLMLHCTCYMTRCEIQTDYVISCNSVDQESWGSESKKVAVTSTMQQYSMFILGFSRIAGILTKARPE